MEPAARRRRRQGDLARAGLYGAILSCLLVLPTLAAPLQIVVNGVQNSKGQVMVAVCTEREFLQPICSYNGRAPARPGPVLVTLEVPPGVYAVQAFHDEASSGQMTTNLLGLPTEPIGFSNNPTVARSAPRFRECSIQVGPMGGRVDIALRKLF